MKADEYLLIISLIFCILSFCAAAWWRYKKYGIPIKNTLLIVWEEGVVEEFEKFRKNLISVGKKVIGWLLECEDKNDKRRYSTVRNSKNVFTLMSVLLALALVAVVLAVKIGSLPIALDVLLVNVFLVLVSEVIIAAFTTFLIICVHWLQRRSSFGILETALHLFFDKMQQKLALKNTQQIAPFLQAFFWLTLYRNKSLLSIDPGPDMGALSPNGWRISYRNDTVYHVFELAMKNEPEQDEKVLQQLINQSITAELVNYGAGGLASSYGGQPAIYLDRLIYDDVRRVLVFDVLYVASDKAAAALIRAWERDRPKAAAPEIEVFDDEL